MSVPSPTTSRPLTGRKVLMIALACFATVIGANMAMLFAATGSFPGLVVKNSYVASQRWQAASDAQEALGWDVQIAYRDGRLHVDATGKDGARVAGLTLEATIGRPSNAAEDKTVVLDEGAQDYAAEIDLAAGLWRVDLRSVQGPAFRAGATLRVREAP